MLTQWITVSSHRGQDLQLLIQSMHEQAGVRALMPRICNANLKGMAQDCTVRLAKFQSFIFLANAEKQETFPKFEDFEDDYFLPFRAQEIVPMLDVVVNHRCASLQDLTTLGPLPTNMKNKWIILLIWIYDTSYDIYIYDIHFSELQISHVWCKQW